MQKIGGDRLEIKKTLSPLIMSEERRLLKILYFCSLFLILVYVVSLIRAIAFPESFHQMRLPISSGDGTLYSFLLSINTHLLVFLLMVSAVLLGYSKPPNGWSILWAGPCVDSFFTWLSMMDGIFRIFIYVVSLSCSLYAFLVFRKYLKKPVEN